MKSMDLNRQLQIVPVERKPPGVEALTPLQIENPDAPGLDSSDWKDEMVNEWEKDWSQHMISAYPDTYPRATW